MMLPGLKLLNHSMLPGRVTGNFIHEIPSPGEFARPSEGAMRDCEHLLPASKCRPRNSIYEL